MKGIFITGTDTIIGKTFVSAVIVRALNGSYWKPVQSGIYEDPKFATDREWVQVHTSLSDEHFFPESYLLRTPLSPHLSAQIDGVQIQLDQITYPVAAHLPLIVEGAGGVLVPLNDKELIIDLIEHLALPVLVVASSRLGTINHTCLTLNALRQRHLTILGVILNGPPNPDNARAIEHYGGVPVLASVPAVEHISPDVLDQIYNEQFNESSWKSLLADIKTKEPPAQTSSRSAPAQTASHATPAQTASHATRVQTASHATPVQTASHAPAQTASRASHSTQENAL